VCPACGVFFPEEMGLVPEGADVVLCPDCYDIWEWELPDNEKQTNT
jgi:hypothetical protein